MDDVGGRRERLEQAERQRIENRVTLLRNATITSCLETFHFGNGVRLVSIKGHSPQWNEAGSKYCAPFLHDLLAGLKVASDILKSTRTQSSNDKAAVRDKACTQITALLAVSLLIVICTQYEASGGHPHSAQPPIAPGFAYCTPREAGLHRLQNSSMIFKNSATAVFVQSEDVWSQVPSAVAGWILPPKARRNSSNTVNKLLPS